jgi:hypothetical protein
MRVGAGCAATLATLQDLFFLALGLWLVARQLPCLVRHQKLCAVEGLPYQLCAWVIGCVDKSGEGNTLTAAQREIAVVLLLFPIRVIISTTHGQGVYRRGWLHTGAFATPVCMAHKSDGLLEELLVCRWARGLAMLSWVKLYNAVKSIE